uniref:ABC transporter domain-containing protein n=1 Tax=Panagrellus redivivus TaxID=6233 RepID=A0A7E4VUD8_PANRE
MYLQKEDGKLAFYINEDDALDCQLIINDLRTKVFGKLLQNDMTFFDKNRVGEIVSRLSSDALVVGQAVSTNLSDGLRSLVTIFGSAGLMVYTSPALCAPVTVVIPIIVGTFYVFGKIQRKFTVQMQEAVAGANNVATERLSNMKTVRILVAEKRELEAYKEKIHAIWEICRKEGVFKGIMFGSFQLTGYLAITSVLFYGTTLISRGLLTYGELSSFCLYSALCVGGLSSLSMFYNELMKGLGASQRLFQLAAEKPTIPLHGGIKLSDVARDIRFEGVAFNYVGRDAMFNDVSFKIPAGKITAIVGPSGSGKSTVAQLLLRLYNPTQGRILVGDHDLRELDPSHWRRMIGTVPQEPVLFSASIWDNIVYGAEDPKAITKEQVLRAAEQSNSLEFINSFPEGFDTLVGESGHSMLSGGQKQRIAIARALITDPKLLIMDEATSALDATSEYLVRKALNALLEHNNKTVVIIAHRLSTIKHADQIVVLDKGCVAELGNYDELMSIPDGVFHKLVEKQAIGWQDNF